VPYVLYDAGKVQINKTAILPTSSNSRMLSGAGLGLRAQFQGLDLDASLAWRGHGGAPQADTSSSKQPQAWISVNYRI